MSRGEFVEIVESTAPNRGTHTGLSLWRILPYRTALIGDPRTPPTRPTRL
jgi:hypothetical protein